MILSQDSFYRELTPAEAAKAMKGTFNFDHPDAFDNQLMESVLTDVINGRQTKVPVYDFKTNSRSPGEFTQRLHLADVLLVLLDLLLVPHRLLLFCVVNFLWPATLGVQHAVRNVIEALRVHLRKPPHAARVVGGRRPTVQASPA